MATSPLSIPEHETSAELLRLPVSQYLEHQLPSPEALMMSYVEADYKGDQATFEGMRVKALLSGMIDNHQKYFNETIEKLQNAKTEQQSTAEANVLGRLALVASED